MKYRTRRQPTDFETRLETELGQRHACILDATNEGIHVELEFGNLEVEEHVEILINQRRYSAKTVWAKEGQAGLQFSEVLPPSIYALVARRSVADTGGKKKRFLMG